MKRITGWGLLGLLLLFLCACQSRTPQDVVLHFREELLAFERGERSVAEFQKFLGTLDPLLKDQILQSRAGFTSSFSVPLHYEGPSVMALLQMKEKEARESLQKAFQARQEYYGVEEVVSRSLSKPIETDQGLFLVIKEERRHPCFGLLQVEGSLLYEKYRLTKKDRNWGMKERELLLEFDWLKEASQHAQEMKEAFFSDLGEEIEFVRVKP